jgi:isopentenyldiphosphate isomerase
VTTPLAQDPDELFDIVTADGEPTGIAKRRADVHRDGDWHRAIHVWIYGCDDAGAFLLMNQRGRHKDTWPLALDATVGGHLGAGESVEDAYREVEEEIGIEVDPGRLQYIWRRARESHGDLPGIIDRELQEIYLCRDDRLLAEFRPNPAELEGLVRLSLPDALALFAHRTESVLGTRLRAKDRAVEPFTVHFDTLITVPDDYFGRVARTIAQVVGGEPGSG